MKSIVLSVPDHHRQAWLNQAADSPGLRQVELSAAALNEVEVKRFIAERGLRVAAVRDIIAPEVTRNLAGLSDSLRHQTINFLSGVLASIREQGIKTVLLDIGAGHYAGEDADQHFGQRVKFVRELVVAASSQELDLCIQARFPRPYPRSPQWDLIGNIIHEVMHPNCRLALDLFPAELEPDFDIRDFLRQCGYHMSVLRFNFEPLAGEGLEREFLLAWHQALQKYLFKGLVAFRPVGMIPFELTAGLGRRLGRWAESIA